MEKEVFEEMVACDFSDLNLEQGGNDNCYCDDDGGCDGRCDVG